MITAAALGIGGAVGGIAATTGGGTTDTGTRVDAAGEPSASEPRAAPPASSTPEVTDVEQPEGLRVSARRWATDFARHTVPLDEFVSGGPGKDAIPTIDNPTFTSIDEAAEYIGPREPVIELELDGEVRVYPIQILIWHEIVNDEIQGVPVAVTFCPLCNTALAFDRTVDGEVLQFAGTGLLRNSDLVMFDRRTESWWQQFGGEAVVGEFAGTELRRIPAAIVAFEKAAAEHPDARVLSRDTGFGRPYGQNPYPGYDSVDVPPFFRVENKDGRLAPRSRVVFIEVGQDAAVIPFDALEKAMKLQIEVGGEKLDVIWQPGVTSTLDDTDIFSPFSPAGPEREEAKVTGSADVRSAETGERVTFDTPFWFAVAAFRPDIEVIEG